MSITRSYYSTDMHEYLGNYLRFLRDYKHLNLMSLYNCFSNTTITIADQDEFFNYFSVPVKFGQIYTIGLDSQRPIDVYCTLWNKGIINSSATRNLEAATRLRIPTCSMGTPFLYTTLKDIITSNSGSGTLDSQNYINFLNCVRLIIKVPKTNSTSITVLEGDYSFDTKFDFNITTEAFYGPIEDKYHLKTYPTELSLFVNDEQQHPFADRLMEYLLDYAVTNEDLLDDNIKRVQEYLLYLRNATPKLLYGVWDESMNDSIYDIAKDSTINKYGSDIIRYIKQKTDLIISEGDSGGTTYNIDLIDVKKDLLMYMDKDVEELFLATGQDDKYTR